MKCPHKVRRNDRQVGKAPFATLDIVGLGRGNLQQVAHRRCDHVVLAFVVVVVLVKLARHGGQGAHDVLGDRRFFGNDEGFHGFYLQSGFMRAPAHQRAHTGARLCME